MLSAFCVSTPVSVLMSATPLGYSGFDGSGTPGLPVSGSVWVGSSLAKVAK